MTHRASRRRPDPTTNSDHVEAPGLFGNKESTSQLEIQAGRTVTRAMTLALQLRVLPSGSEDPSGANGIVQLVTFPETTGGRNPASKHGQNTDLACMTCRASR